MLRGGCADGVGGAGNGEVFGEQDGAGGRVVERAARDGEDVFAVVGEEEVGSVVERLEEGGRELLVEGRGAELVEIGAGEGDGVGGEGGEGGIDGRVRGAAGGEGQKKQEGRQTHNKRGYPGPPHERRLTIAAQDTILPHNGGVPMNLGGPLGHWRLKPSTNMRGRSPRVSAWFSSVWMVCRSPGISET